MSEVPGKKETGPYVAVRQITEEGKPFFLGISTIIADYFENIPVTADIIPFEESGIVAYSSHWGIDEDLMAEAVPSLREPLSAQYGTFGFMPIQRGGTALTLVFQSEALIAEQEAIAASKKSIGVLPATSRVNLAAIPLGPTLEFPRLNLATLNQTAMDLGVVGTNVTLAPAYYL